MDFRASSTAALSKKFGSSTGSTSIYDGVFSVSDTFRGSSLSSRVEDFGEIFNGSGDSRRSSSIPVLDVPGLRERKVSFDARRSRLEYDSIFGGSAGSDDVTSYEDLPVDSRKMRNFTREERTRVGTRSPSEVSLSGSEDSHVLPHSSDKAKKINLSYNRSNLGSKDGTNGTTHVTQLHDVPGFARVIDGIDAASARDGDEKAKSPVFSSTLEKSHKNVNQNVSPFNGYSTPSRFFTNNFNSKDVEASPSKVSACDGGEVNFDFSPSYFDEELDTNSAAAASAAAVRKAIDQAQEKIKIAKEIMERRKDMFQGNSYFNGSGARKKKEAKKAKKVIQFSEMEENAEPNRFATSHLMNVEDISGQRLEFRCDETQAQTCIRERDSMDGDEENEMRTLEKKIEISEKRSDDYEMEKTVTDELSFEDSIESEGLSILENSNLPANIVGHECDVYGDDHESAERQHYLEENKKEFKVESEEQSVEKIEGIQCEEELQELRISEVEKQLEDQSMECIHEEILKKPEESNEEEEEICRGWMDSGKNFEDDESKELNVDADELLEKSDCLPDGEEKRDRQEEDAYSEMQQEGEEIQTKVDLQIKSKSQEIQVPSNLDESDNELESSFESNENVVVAKSDDLEEKEVRDTSSLDHKDKAGTFSLSWGSLNVSEITGLNENTVKLGFTDISIGQCQNVEESETGGREEESSSSSSSSGKGEAEAFINQEDELSDYDDSLIDSEVNVETDWQPNMFEKEETIEAKSNQSSDEEDEKSDSLMEPPPYLIQKTEEEVEKEKERERKREQEKERIAVDRAIREARERAFADVRERAERAAVEKATTEARQRMAAHAREKMAKTEAAAVTERRFSEEAKLRVQRAAVERATAEARERALEKALSDKLSGIRRDSKVRQRSMNEPQQKSSSSSSNSRNSSSSNNGAPPSGGANDESDQRSKARLERHQRTAERAAKALAEKNMRDLIAQREQAEKNRLAEALDADIKRWSSGKHGNLRALLSTLQYILGAESGWQAVTLTEIVTSAAVKKAYRKATLCVHPDKLQQRGASLQQKYICEKVFDLLKEAWNRFRAEEK